MHRHAPKTRRVGFTLVELLIVVALLATLMAMLLPTLGRAQQLAKLAKSRAWIVTLGDACEAYYRDNSYYPGQQYPGDLKGNNNNSANAFTGSQYLARAFFTELDTTAPITADSFKYDVAITKYVKAQESDLLPPPSATPIRATNDPIQISINNNTNMRFPRNLSDATRINAWNGWKYISSRYANMPVLYFPARLGVIGVQQYKYNDNDVEPYKAPAFAGSTVPPDDQTARNTFWGTDYPNGSAGWVVDSRLSPPIINPGGGPNNNYISATKVPHSPGKFILVAPGQDGLYFTKDDIVYPNWN